MVNKKLIKVLVSIPVILLAMYFIPILGILLIIFRYVFYKGNKIYQIPKYFLVIGIVILFPLLTSKINGLLRVEVPFLNDIVNNDIYSSLITYSKRLLIVGVLALFISYIVWNVLLAAKRTVKNYVADRIKEENEINEKNDLIEKEKQTRAKNTHAVKCPHCGEVNIITSQTGTCKYCRNKIEYKK